VIFEVIIVRLLHEGRRRSIEIGQHHVGDNGSRLGQVELSIREAHGSLPKILVAPQKLCIDCANLVESFAELVQIADELRGESGIGVAHIISVGPFAGSADGEIMLGPMAGAVDAVAVGSAAAFEGRAQGPAHDLFDRRNLLRYATPAFAQGGS
jgi:hypothetical protein